MGRQIDRNGIHFNPQHSHLEAVASISLTTSHHTCSIEEKSSVMKLEKIDLVFYDHLSNS